MSGSTLIPPSTTNSPAVLAAEGAQVQRDATWLAAHKSDPNIKQELAAYAPTIEKNWEKFQGDAATQLQSSDPSTRQAAFNIASGASQYFSAEANNMNEILNGPLAQSLELGDPTAQGIQQQFAMTIDQGNQLGLGGQQALNSEPEIDPNLTPTQASSYVFTPAAGGNVSAANVAAEARQIQAETAEGPANLLPQ